jgi:hypothetical protein
VPAVGVVRSGYCHWAVKGEHVVTLTPLPFLKIKEQKRRRPVVVLKVLRVLKVLGMRKATLALGFKTF